MRLYEIKGRHVGVKDIHFLLSSLLTATRENLENFDSHVHTLTRFGLITNTATWIARLTRTLQVFVCSRASAYALLSLALSLCSPPWHRLISFYKSRCSTSCLCNEQCGVNRRKINIKLHIMLWVSVYGSSPHFVDKNSMRHRCFISTWKIFLIPLLLLIRKGSWLPWLNSPWCAISKEHNLAFDRYFWLMIGCCFLRQTALGFRVFVGFQSILASIDLTIWKSLAVPHRL